MSFANIYFAGIFSSLHGKRDCGATQLRQFTVYLHSVYSIVCVCA